MVLFELQLYTKVLGHSEAGPLSLLGDPDPLSPSPWPWPRGSVWHFCGLTAGPEQSGDR